MNPFVGVLIVVAGLGILGVALSFRVGRSPGARWWVQSGVHAQNQALLLVPGAGSMLIGAGLIPFTGQPLVALVMIVSLIFGVLLVLWSAAIVPVPVWLVPGWARDSVRSRRQAEKRSRTRRRKTSR